MASSSTDGGDVDQGAGAAYTIRAVLQSNDVSLSPDAAAIVEGSIAVVRGIIEGTKKFVRFYTASWIQVRALYASTSTESTVPT